MESAATSAAASAHASAAAEAAAAAAAAAAARPLRAPPPGRGRGAGRGGWMSGAGVERLKARAGKWRAGCTWAATARQLAVRVHGALPQLARQDYGARHPSHPRRR